MPENNKNNKRVTHENEQPLALAHFVIGAELNETIKNMTRREQKKYERRDFVKPLIDYCTDGCYGGNLGIVFGLRTTGKSVGMLQCCEELLRQKLKVAYARFDYKATGMDSVTQEIKRLIAHGYTHFFVDEASYLNGFLSLAAEWADRIIPGNSVKIVISGTDSFLLWLSEGSTLVHRHVEFSTNYTNYAEYKRVWVGDYEAYKQSGGLFAVSRVDRYIQQSVVDNLLHTLDHCIDDANQRNIFTDVLYGLDAVTIYKAVNSILKCAAELAIKKNFIRHSQQMTVAELGTAIAGWEDEAKSNIKTKIAMSMDLYKEFQGIKSPENVIDALISYLEQIGCLAAGESSLTGLVSGQTNYYFTQNALMFYAVRETISAISKVADIDRAKFQSAALKAAEGAMNETIVFNHALFGAKPAEKVFKYQDRTGREIDAVIKNRESKRLILVEVKSAAAVDESRVFFDEARHLYNEAVIDNLTEGEDYQITRVLAYQGESRSLSHSGGELLLVNIEDLILHNQELEIYLKKLIERPAKTESNFERGIRRAKSRVESDNKSEKTNISPDLDDSIRGAQNSEQSSKRRPKKSHDER